MMVVMTIRRKENKSEEKRRESKNMIKTKERD